MTTENDNLTAVEKANYVTRKRRDGWPSNVSPISLEGLDQLGIDVTTNQLHWNGAPLVTKHQLGQREFFLASLAAWATALAAVAMIADLFRHW